VVITTLALAVVRRPGRWQVDDGQKAWFFPARLREKRASLLKMDKKSPLPLLVAGVRANDVHHAPAAHDLAVLADLLD
jgi:hypothetical protein